MVKTKKKNLKRKHEDEEHLDHDFTENQSKTFTIEQPNQCKLKFNIPVSMINTLNKELDKNHEISGVIHCDNNNNVVGMKTEKGNADSVYTPNDVINFHTHPISAYNQGDTVWGWPSGEDIRETIKFSLAGNKAHLVFSVEGLYTIQISPCKIRKMKQLTDEERGILIFIIEEYFKTTHNFRGVKEVNDLAKKNIYINPYSYVDFVNTFDLINLLNAKKIVHNSPKTEHTKNIGHTGIHSYDNDNINRYGEGDSTFTRIPNVGFPDVRGGKIVNQSVNEYISKDDLKELRKITEKGKENDFRIKDINTLVQRLKEILAKFDSTECNITWNNKNNAWFFVNFFPSNNYRQKSYQNGNTFVTPSKVPVTTDIEPFIRVFSDKSEGCTVNAIAQSNKFKIGRMTSMGSKNCTRDHGHFCGFGNKHSIRFGNKHSIRLKRYSLKTLLKDLRKVSGSSFGVKKVKKTKEEKEQEKQARRIERERIREEKRKKKEKISNAKKLRDLLIKELGLSAGNESMDELFLDKVKRKNDYSENKEKMSKITDLVKILHLKIGEKTTLWEVNGMCSRIIHS